jgi:hypothetical protein
MSIAFQYWYLMQGGEGLPAGAIAYKNRVEADGGTTTSLGCVPSQVWEWAESYNAQTQAMIDKAIAEGFALPSAANLRLINDAIDGLIAAGAWNTKADVIRFWGNDSGSANFGRINAVNPSSDLAVLVNAVGFVNKKGVEGDGVSARVDTKYNPSVDAVNYALDSASIMLYQYKVATTGFALYGGGATQVLRLQSRNQVIQRVNVASNLSSSVNFAQVGTLGVHRKDSVNVDVQTNGTISARTYSGSAVLPNYDLTIFATVGATQFSNAGVSLEWIGSDASSVGVAIHNILDTYYTQLQLL